MVESVLKSKKADLSHSREVVCMSLSVVCLGAQPNVTMSGRLASFRGPSSPSSSPVARPRNPSGQNSPSNSRASELPFHRKLRTNLQEIRKIAETWDDIVCIDGAKAAKALIDARTNLEYVQHSFVSEREAYLIG